MSIQNELDNAHQDLLKGGDAVNILVSMMNGLGWRNELQNFFYDRFTDDPFNYDEQAIVDEIVLIDFTLEYGY